jgi:hypothetical protein
MHNGTLKHHNYNTKIFVDEVENLLNQLKGKTTIGQPNFGKHYMKIQITDSRKYSQPLKICVLCKNNKLLACFLTDHLYSLHLFTDPLVDSFTLYQCELLYCGMKIKNHKRKDSLKLSLCFLLQNQLTRHIARRKPLRLLRENFPKKFNFNNNRKKPSYDFFFFFYSSRLNETHFY